MERAFDDPPAAALARRREPPAARARLLGPFELTDPGGGDILPRARKARALLAFLTLAPGRGATRRELMAFAWADRSEEQANASLRQALRDLRPLAATQPPLLAIDPSRVDLVGDLDSDLARVLAHARGDHADDLARELGRWRGPALAGLDGIDEAIDRWLSRARADVENQVHAEVAACVARLQDAGGAERCAPLVTFLIGLRPTDDATSRLAMSWCARHRDAPEVAREFERLKAALRRDRNAAPAVETVALHDRLTSTSGRREVAAGASPDAGAPAAVSGPWRWAGLWGLLVLVAVLGLAIGRWPPSRRGDAVLLVEPLRAAPSDPAAQLVRAGLSGDLSRILVGKPAGLAIVQAGDRDQAAPRAQLSLTGDAATSNGVTRVQLQLRNTRTGTILWSQNFSREATKADALREQVATKLGAVLDCALGTRHRGVAPVADRATSLYLRACDLIGDYDLVAALDLLRQVTRAAPGFPRAWADLAVTGALVGEDLPPPQRAAAFEEADRNARRALRMDPGTGLAYYALATTQPGIANWSRRVALVESGLRVEPDSSELNNFMGRELLRVGRSREGLVYLRRSMTFDPLNPVKTTTLVPPLAFYEDVDEAEALADKAMTLWPDNPLIWDGVFRMESRVGDPRKALAMLRDPNRPELKGEQDASRWRITLRARLEPSRANVDAAVAPWRALAARDPGSDPLASAGVLAALGRTDLAYDLIATSKAPLDDDADESLFRGYMAAFRSDPRFTAVAERRGLIAIWRTTGRPPDVCAQPAPPAVCGDIPAVGSPPRPRR